MAKFKYLLKTKLNINGKNILCKVTGNPGSAQDGAPYILVVTGGPGFGHELNELYLKPLIDMAAKKNQPLPHFILFDHLGCGESDKATNPDKEYTVDHFTDIAAEVVKGVKEKLHLKGMDLQVDGGSFGALVAGNMPARKPEWLDPNSDIKIKQITLKVSPKGADEQAYSLNFLKKHYGTNPNYKKLVAAQHKLFDGKLQDKADYVINFVLPMSSLYAKNIDTPFNQLLKKLVTYAPNTMLTGLDITDRLFKFLGIENEPLILANTTLGKCSIEVLNHFFRHDFDGFNLIETIAKNKSLYEQIPICFIAASEDHIVDYHLSKEMHRLLPHSSAVVIFKGAHMLLTNPGDTKKICNNLIYDLYINGHVDITALNNPSVVFEKEVTDEFNAKLQDAHRSLGYQSDTTTRLLKTMPLQIAATSSHMAQIKATTKEAQPAATPLFHLEENLILHPRPGF